VEDSASEGSSVGTREFGTLDGNFETSSDSTIGEDGACEARISYSYVGIFVGHADNISSTGHRVMESRNISGVGPADEGNCEVVGSTVG